MDKVLFSFVGKSDPVMNNWDGPLIHILRNYKIQRVYLYFSKEMIERDKTNVYERTIKALDDSIDVIKIYRPNLDNPHIHGAIDDDIVDLMINRVKNENPNSIIYANLSSGTPQMCSSLNLISMSLPFPVHLLQVENPEPFKMERRSNINDYMDKSGEEIINDSLDSIEPINRCIEVKSKNILKLIINENVSSLLDSYNYFDAMKLINKYSDLYSSEVNRLIERLYYIYNSNHEKARKIQTIEEFYPIGNARIMNIYNYLLYLNTKQELGIITEFARAISPANTFLLVLAINKYFKVDLPNSYFKGTKYGNRIDYDKLINDYPDIDLSENHNSKFISTKNLFTIYTYFLKKNDLESKLLELTKSFNLLLEFETNFRNASAHEISSFTDNDLNQLLGVNSKGIMDKLKFVFMTINSEYNNQINWNFYKDMNLIVKSKMKGAYNEE